MERREWVKGKTIGRGAFGTVSLAVGRNPGRFPPVFAVKSTASTFASFLQNEADVLSQLPYSPRIVRFFGGEWELEGDSAYNLFLEYVPGGSLSNRLRRGGKLDEFSLRVCAREILEGLAHIHDHGFVHCDVKPQNVMIDPISGVKIIDFGLASRAGEDSKRKTVIRGTPMYVPPEIVNGEKPSPKADIWSLGCTLVELASGKPPWKITLDGNNHVLWLLYRIGISDELPEIPSEISDKGKDFLRRCLVKDAWKRWTAKMLLQHEFVNLDRHDSICLNDAWEELQSPNGALDVCWTESPSCSSLTSPETWSLGSQAAEDQGHTVRTGNSPARRIADLATCQNPKWSQGNWVAVRQSRPASGNGMKMDSI